MWTGIGYPRDTTPRRNPSMANILASAAACWICNDHENVLIALLLSLLVMLAIVRPQTDRNAFWERRDSSYCCVVCGVWW